ncbi:TRAP transporter TatT component family protein [Pendulispora albinea]|uniref:TRAP transporter TatT component family protein n=1 Tax=Pendulispora albinea TaxID=2741071 RepID=A0ABZ2LVX4_9BACT
MSSIRTSAGCARALVQKLAPLAVLSIVSGVFGTGCFRAIATKTQISATREASDAFNTIGDYELAKSAASAGLVQFEGMHVLAPSNEDALFLLLKGWVGYAFAFPEDDYEAASDAGDDDLAEYHKKRTRMAYERAIFYGVELLKERESGFDDAKKNDAALRSWLDKSFSSKEDAEILFWLGYGWLGRTNIAKDDPAVVADLFVAVALLDRSRKLDPNVMHHGAETAIASYHARSAVAELDQSKTMFEDVLAKTQRKSLVVQLNYASRYACLKGDRPLYEKLLNEVLTAEDPDPGQRLANTVAKRRAKRYLGKAHMTDCGFDMSTPAAPKANPPSKT